MLITHGGGSSMLLQTNDTDLHQEVRKRFVEQQEMLQVRKIRAEGGGMADLSREENLAIMIDVMSDPDLHLQAAKGYKKNRYYSPFGRRGRPSHCTRGEDVLG